MGKKLVLVAIAVLAIGGSVTWIYFQMPGRRPRIEMDPYRALGEIAAERTVGLLNQHGQVVLVAHDYPGDGNPVEAAEIKAFTHALQKGGVRVAATESFRYTSAAEQMLARGSVPRERFLQILQGHPGVAAFVLFAGFPPLAEPDLDRLKQSGAKVVMVTGFGPDDKRLMDGGWVHLAFVPRLDTPQPGPKPAQNLRETFDRYYLIVEPAKTSGSP